jgi:hypothetical protein
MVIAIDKAEYLEDYKILFQFSDGSKRIVDFTSFLENARNPMTRKYLNKDLFRDFKIEYGDITWNNFELCFPIWDLFKGKI